MVTKRIRSEYMNKFKDPKWETYARCYEDLVNYRLSRRLLEQAHNPWFWDECGSISESSCKSPPPNKSQVEPQHLQKEVETAPVLQTAGSVSAQTYPAHEKEPKAGQVRDEVVEDFKPDKGEEKSKVQSTVQGVVRPETSPCVQNKTRCKLQYSQKPLRNKAKNNIIKDTDKDSRHPFAMYGSGERKADMASKRTHNVGPAASTREIHESALRAKTRRETEKQMKKVVRRRVKSADTEKINKVNINPDYNPWMTEYMRCFSARSQ